jgi:hypothetical protein
MELRHAEATVDHLCSSSSRVQAAPTVYLLAAARIFPGLSAQRLRVRLRESLRPPSAPGPAIDPSLPITKRPPGPFERGRPERRLPEGSDTQPYPTFRRASSIRTPTRGQRDTSPLVIRPSSTELGDTRRGMIGRAATRERNRRGCFRGHRPEARPPIRPINLSGSDLAEIR